MANFGGGHLLKPLENTIKERTLNFGQYCLRSEVCKRVRVLLLEATNTGM
jgi:hypothetical protein